ncbi:uracil-DNA glycosylase family protein [Formicincola oecophyllae]|uniref:uracil-DNA glycosylase family protein n=1 Tax=Formicincola oecophyllae TaxID=2558361 RepID=UPI001F1185F5|nr:uracil-DNA glycosylase family protein [Formicincola oecophyllae]
MAASHTLLTSQVAPAPEAFQDLLKAIKQCRLCVECPRNGKPLPHAPRPVLQASPSASICIVGQAPGLRVHHSGRPFTDPSGMRLRSWLNMDEATFYDPARVALVPMGFCFPGYSASKSDLPPRVECTVWRERIFAQMPHLKLMVILGGHAQRWHLGPAVAKRGVNEVVASWRDYLEGPHGVRRFVLPHPSWRNNAWLKRNPWFAEEVLPVLRQDVAKALG